MSWVRIPPEQLFSFRRKKELFGLVALPFFLFIGLRVFMQCGIYSFNYYKCFNQESNGKQSFLISIYVFISNKHSIKAQYFTKNRLLMLQAK